MHSIERRAIRGKKSTIMKSYFILYGKRLVY